MDADQPDQSEGIFELAGAQDELKDGLEAIAAGMGEFRKGLKNFSKKGIRELTTLGDELMGGWIVRSF